MLRVLGNISSELDPEVKAKGQIMYFLVTNKIINQHISVPVC